MDIPVPNDDPLRAGWSEEALRAAGGTREKRRPAPPPAPEEADDRPPEFTDESLALRFSARHAADLRYVAGWGRWLLWDGTAWRFDETLKAFDLSRAVCRQASAECNKGKIASQLASAKTVAAVERLAKADRRHAATVEQWDSDPWLLNTPGGVVDLRTGRIQSHRPELCMTKIAAVAPAGDCPLWREFLHRITGGDAELHGFLQRVAGYALTGITREHALFFGYGTGANGKGTFLNTVSGILGGYATIAPMETFTASSGDRHPTDLAMLRGARLVAAQETEEGRRWAESKIKALTGGDPITARFMRQDFFTFTPPFKLFIAGNHKPGLRGVDEAIRRRFHLIPFVVTIPAEERDPELAEKLKGEWAGILAWAVEGCLQWQRIGLAAPKAVREATEHYLDAEDALTSWMTECCNVSPRFHTGSSILFASWRAWAERAGEMAGSQKRFAQALEARGFMPRRLANDCAGFLGIGIKPEPEDDRRWGA